MRLRRRRLYFGGKIL